MDFCRIKLNIKLNSDSFVILHLLSHFVLLTICENSTTTSAPATTEKPTPPQVQDPTYHPIIKCHTNFSVSVDPGLWEYVHVVGTSDAACENDKDYGTLTFNMKQKCLEGVDVVDSTLQFTYEVLVYEPATLNYDKRYNRKYFASCNYSITGDAYWNPESKTVQRNLEMEPQLVSEREIVLNASKAFLVDDNNNNDELNSIKVGDLVRIKIVADDVTNSEDYSGFGVTGCAIYGESESDQNYYAFNLIDQDGCNTHPDFYNPFRSVAGSISYNGSSVALSDPFLAFKFPGSTSLYLKCSIVFCVSSDDDRCQSPNSCPSSRRRRKRSSSVKEVDSKTNIVIKRIYVFGEGEGIITGPPDFAPSPYRPTYARFDCHRKTDQLIFVIIFLALLLVIFIFLNCKEKEKARKKISPYLDSTVYNDKDPSIPKGNEKDREIQRDEMDEDSRLPPPPPPFQHSPPPLYSIT